MNTLLKAMLKEVSDLVATGEAIASKDWIKVLSLLVADGSDLPSIISNWSDLKPELDKLVSDPTSDADLLSYAMALVGGESAKAQLVIQASAKLALDAAMDISSLVKAIQS